jgi:hypothetical protein
MVLKDTHRASINIDKDNKIPVRVVHGNDAENIALYLAGDEYKDTRYNDVQVDFYDNMLGMVRTMCNVVIKRNPNYPSRMDEQWMGDCTIRTVQEIVQRQKDVRVNVSIEIPFSSEKRADFYGTVTNISAGGIFMITSEELEPGEVLSFRYMFHTMDRRYYVKTVWRRPTEDGHIGYGFQFINLPSGGEADIRGYVFKVLRDEYAFREAERSQYEDDMAKVGNSNR